MPKFLKRVKILTPPILGPIAAWPISGAKSADTIG